MSETFKLTQTGAEIQDRLDGKYPKIELQGAQVLDERRARNAYILEGGTADPADIQDGDLLFYYTP